MHPPYQTILVTGSSGQLGREIVRQLREKGYTVVGADLVASPTTDLLLDLRDVQAVWQACAHVDAIIHTAAMHGKEYALGYPRSAFIETNIGGTFHLLQACVAHGIKKLVYTSTTSIYGKAMQAPDRAVWVTETLTPEPRDIYDITKLTAEMLCRDYFEKEGIQTVSLRISRFLPEPGEVKALHRLYRGLDERDGAMAHILALEKSFDQFEIFNISGKTPFQEHELLDIYQHPKKLIIKYFPESESIFAKNNWQFPEHIDRVYVIEKAMRLLGYQPRYNFTEILKENR